MSTGRFVWHELSTPDVDASEAFYRELLGWETEMWKAGEMDYRMISVGGKPHGGFAKLDPATGVPPHWLGHVHVEDADAAAARAEANGGTVLAGPFDVPEVGRFVIVADPRGAAFSLYTPSGEAPEPEGVFVWDELITTDVEGAKAFYRDVVGWTAREWDGDGAGGYALLGDGETDRAGVMATPDGMPVEAAWMTYVGTGDADATVAAAEGLGATVVAPPFDVPGVGRIAVLADPAGAVFGLFQPAAL
ncbi:MAG: VOC family protein [Thermoleophilia bacterium]|nr:VOC family protein [Thermoleophilia bacterium]